MKEQLLALNKVKVVGRVLKGSPFRSIPAVENYQHVLQKYNPILEQLGVKLRLPSEEIVEINKANKKMNRYLKRTILRIRKLVSENNYKMAWHIALLNMKYSTTFRVSAFNYVKSGWYFDTAVSEIYKINRKVNKIIFSMASNLDFTRVYIPKSNNRWRPLGVPKVEWRIALHLYNNFFIEILKTSILPNQHAYIPGRGVITAWKEILNKVQKYDYIYETDLKGFFDNVSIWKIVSILKENETPKRIIDWVFELCRSVPKFPSEKLIDESRFDIDYNEEGVLSRETRPKYVEGYVPKMLVESEENPYHENWEEYPEVSIEYLKSITTKLPIYYFKPDFKNFKVVLKSEKELEAEHYEDEPDFMKKVKVFNKEANEMRKLIDPLKVKSASNLPLLEKLNFGITQGGVPQGMPLSPFLSILGLKDYLSQVPSVNYADDQIFYSNKPFEIKDDPENGIIHASEKCGWVKYNGKWTLNGLKFLGLKLKDGKLYSETRKGIYDTIPEQFLEIYNKQRLENIKNINTTDDLLDAFKNKVSGNYEEYLVNMSNRKIFGFILSCLYIKDWTNNHSLKDQIKGYENLYERIHKKALLNKIPKNTDSSSCVTFLHKAIERTMKKSSLRLSAAKRIKIS